MDRPFIFSETAKMAWRQSQFRDGVSVKDLGTSDGQSMQLVRFEPGVQFPWHRHAGPEFIYVLEGEVTQRGWRLGPGDAGIAPANTEEDDFFSEKEATFVLVYTD